MFVFWGYEWWMMQQFECNLHIPHFKRGDPSRKEAVGNLKGLLNRCPPLLTSVGLMHSSLVFTHVTRRKCFNVKADWPTSVQQLSNSWRGKKTPFTQFPSHVFNRPHAKSPKRAAVLCACTCRCVCSGHTRWRRPTTIHQQGSQPGSSLS